MELISSLDLQIPTLLLGDFNGSVYPDQDFSSGEGSVCRLLTRLVGPGGPFLDLQLVVSPELRAYTFCTLRGSALSRSRCDLALGNRAVLGLISKVYVESGILDGGHSPVVVELRDTSPWTLQWTCPRPHLPPLLSPSCSDLNASKP